MVEIPMSQTWRRRRLNKLSNPSLFEEKWKKHYIAKTFIPESKFKNEMLLILKGFTFLSSLNVRTSSIKYFAACFKHIAFRAQDIAPLFPSGFAFDNMFKEELFFPLLWTALLYEWTQPVQ